MTYPLDRKLIVEFIGMFIFMFTVGMATNHAGAGVLAPLAIGAVLMVMVFAGGHVSGGHFNPAVSTAVLVRGRMSSRECMAYAGTQVVSAILAGLVVRWVGGHETAAPVASAGKMLVAEFVLTFALAWVVLHVATARGTLGSRSGSPWWRERSRSVASRAGSSTPRSRSAGWSQGCSSGATSGST
jgi:aquaporin Z